MASKEKKEFLEKAKKERMKFACTDEKDGSYTWRSVYKTSRKDLGEYGVGIRLYFDFLFQMGLIFLLLAVVSSPSLTMYAMGSMLDGSVSSNRFIASLTVANLGGCEGGECRSEQDKYERFVHKDSDKKVRDVTEGLGFLDALVVLIFLFFGLGFQYFWVRRVVNTNDKDHITPSDYAVQIHGLPANLGEEGHKDYEDKLKQHLLKVLKLPGPKKTRHEGGVVDGEAIQEIALVRNYQGAIEQFMDKGLKMEKLAEVEKKKSLAEQETGKEQKVQKLDGQIEKVRDEIAKAEKKFASQAQIAEADRAVCTAYVMLNKESQKGHLQWQYRYAQTGLFRLCQGEELRFEGRRLRVTHPSEPSDLYWENLDFPAWKRKSRKAVVFILTIVVLMVCIAILVGLKQDVALSGGDGTRVWVLMNHASSGAPCLQVCEWRLFENQNCRTSGSDSSTWNGRIFDATESASNTLNTTADGNDGCTQRWTSPSCSAGTQVVSAGVSGTTTSTPGPSSGPLAQDWIAVEFPTDKSVNVDIRCMHLHQPVNGAGNKFRLLACKEDALPPDGDTSNWRPEEMCVPMEDIVTGGSEQSRVAPDTLCGAVVTEEAAARAIDNGADPVADRSVSCFCQQQWRVDRSFIAPPYDTPAKELCQKWSYAEASKQGMTAGTILAVLVLNQMLFAIFARLVKFERLRTVTEVTKEQMSMLFVALFVNTGVVVLLVNWETLGGHYDDFNLDFFPNVCAPLVVTVALQTLSNTAPQAIMSFVVTPLTTWFFQRNVVSQEMLNRLYKLPEWNLALRLAQCMNVIFCVFMWSSAMPILYFIGFVYCTVAYWMDKTVLLWGSCKPPMYDEHIVLRTLTFFPAAAVLHSLVALLIYGRQDLFPSDWSALAWVPELLFEMTTADSEIAIEEYAASIGTYEEYIRARFIDIGRKACWPLLLMVLFFIGLFITRYSWDLILRPICNPLELIVREIIRKWCGKGRIDDDTNDSPYTEERKNLNKKGKCNSYMLKGNNRYDPAAKALKHTEDLAKSGTWAEVVPGTPSSHVTQSEVCKIHPEPQVQDVMQLK